MFFTPIIAMIGLAAAAPCASNPAHSTNATAPDPSTYENIDISDLSIREILEGNTLNVIGVESASFTLNGNLTCESDVIDLTGVVYGCADSSKYSFAVVNGSTTDYALRIYHDLGGFAGFYGEGDVPTYCRSGGGSVEICDQVNPTTIVIDAQ